MSSAPPSTALRWDKRLWITLLIACGVMFLDGLDVSMIGVALPQISADLDLTTSQMQWIVSGYVLGYGGLLLLGGRVADLLGRRRVLMTGLTVFTLASLVGGLVSDPTIIVVTRFVKGMAAAFTAPAALSLVTTNFAEGHARNKALSIYTAVAASGFSLGLVFGGLLTEIGWRWTFLLPVPFAAAVLASVVTVLRKDAPTARPKGAFDLPGAVTVVAGMLLLVRGIVQAPEVGWADVQTILSLSGAVALLALFVAIESRTRQPILRLGILRNGALVRANLGAMATFGCYLGFQFVATMFFQSVLGWSALETALAFLPAGLIVAFGSPRVGLLIERFGTPRVVAAGFVAFAGAYALFLGIDGSPNYALEILPTMLLIGIGFALAFPSLNIQGTAGVANEEQGLASGLVQTSFQVGGAVSLAVVTAVLNAESTLGVDAFLDAMRPALGVVAGLALVGLFVALSAGLTRRQPAAAGELATQRAE